eukprot:4306809-Prymnesium_polylepis.1
MSQNESLRTPVPPAPSQLRSAAVRNRGPVAPRTLRCRVDMFSLVMRKLVKGWCGGAARKAFAYTSASGQCGQRRSGNCGARRKSPVASRSSS